MAAVLKLVRRRDYGADIDTLDLLDYNDGFNLARDGWIPSICDEKGSQDVDEAFTLRVRGSSHNDLASKIQDLKQFIAQRPWYEDPADLYGVWLRTKMADETNSRQALVKSIRAGNATPILQGPARRESFLQKLPLALVRTPLWEDTNLINRSSVNLNCLGGWDDIETVYGDMPARIAYLQMNGATGGGGPIYEMWIGFRTSRYGSAANFVRVWECESGTLGTDASIVSDSTASGDSKVRCSFGTTTTMAARITVALSDVTSNYDEQRGLHTILLRAKLTSSGEAHVRLLDGFSSANAFRQQSRVKITSTSWKLYPIGTVSLPPSRGRYTDTFLQAYSLRLNAERVSGSCSLDMDCFGIVPRNEGMVHFSGAACQKVGADPRPATICQHADGPTDGWSYSGGYPTAELEVSPYRYGLPTGAGKVILFGQRETSHDEDDFVAMSLFAYQRWLFLRGSEG